MVIDDDFRVKNDLKKYNISYNYRDTYTTFLSYEVKFNDEIYQNISKYNESYDYLSNNPVKSVIYYVDSVADLKSYSDQFAPDFKKYFAIIILNFLNCFQTNQ